jgi:hypothetical protein
MLSAETSSLVRFPVLKLEFHIGAVSRFGPLDLMRAKLLAPLFK